jgi:DNA-binding XRE family transcriptional regulator
MNMDNISFGNWLKGYRRSLDLTQEQLAQHIGYATITIRKIENDDIRPSKQLAERLADKLKIPSNERQAFIEFARSRTPVASSFQPLSSKTNMIPWRHSLSNSINIPLPLTEFFGREQDLIALRNLLLQPLTHLITLIGPPGIGKTRLSIHAATELKEQ